MNLKIKKLNSNARLPSRAHPDDAGIDLYSLGDYIIKSGETKVVQTGIALEIPHGYVGLIWDKSGISSKGVKTLGGVIDAGYRGEVGVIIHNLSDSDFTFVNNSKVAQMLIQKVELFEIEEVDDLHASNRGTGGFGSTGK